MAVSLNTYNGPWERSQVKHYLRRLRMGVNLAELDQSLKAGFEASINDALRPINIAPPVNHYSDLGTDDAAGVPYGETWVTSPFNQSDNYRRKQSVRTWWLVNLLENGSFHQKLSIFWHHHFATELDIYQDPRYAYKYFDTIHNHAFGNFKNMVKEISLSPAMLIYLNTVDNRVGAPDENFARELQELFTIGKEYEDRYTEEDVQEAAKVLTGYQVIRNQQGRSLEYTFNSGRHDTSDKVFSQFYGNTTISGRGGNSGENEFDDLLAMIFKKNQVSEHIVRNLYRFFVHSDIDEEVEANIIKPLAEICRENDFELLPVYEKLFKSEHFWDSKFIGSQIKSPVEFAIGTLKTFDARVPSVSEYSKERYLIFQQVHTRTGRMQQKLFDPPNVSGWQAYYQAPVFYKTWINSATMTERAMYSRQILQFAGFRNNGIAMDVDVISFAQKLPGVADANSLIENLVELMFAVKPSVEDLTYLRNNFLLNNTSELDRWSEDWKTYLENPENNTYINRVRNKLRFLYYQLSLLPEYQLN